MGYLVEILGLRNGEAFFERGWRANSVKDLFSNTEHYLDAIPKEDRWNLFYTVAECTGRDGDENPKARLFGVQRVIPFDIDAIGEDAPEDVAEAALHALGLNWEDVGIVSSGHGVHLLIGVKEPFTSPDYFEKYRENYKVYCEKIDQELITRGLSGKADPTVFSRARILRLPGTWNKKPGKPDKLCQCLQNNISDTDFSLESLVTLPKVSKHDEIPNDAFKQFGPLDQEGILSSCLFLKYARDNQTQISEPEWYAMISLVGRLKDGRNLVHEFSKAHPGYSERETDLKLKQALSKSGPRTCKNIDTLWQDSQCSKCAFYGKCATPLQIKSEKFIASKDTGFWKTKWTEKGPVPSKPDYEGLWEYFCEQHPYVVLDSSRMVYAWNGKYWEELPDARIEGFAQDKLKPKPMETHRREFLKYVKNEHLVTDKWLDTGRPHGMINFINGVLDVRTMDLLPHNSRFKFFTSLPIEWKPELAGSESEHFDKFMHAISCGRPELEETLLQFAGYALSGDPYWEQRTLVLYGDTANGKSTFLKLLDKLFGNKNVSLLNMKEMCQPEYRYDLIGKLINISEETPPDGLANNAVFKGLTSGADMYVKKLYYQPQKAKNYAKFIFSCNTLPVTADSLNAVMRRMIIVPFDADFKGDNADKFIDQKLATELEIAAVRMVMAYKRMLEANSLFVAESVMAEILEYGQQVDFVTSWFEENVMEVEDKEAFITMGEFYNNYVIWSEGNGSRPKDRFYFFELIRKILPHYKKRKFQKRYPSGKRKWCLRGVAVRLNEGEMP